jgi:hypothetical protein
MMRAALLDHVLAGAFGATVAWIGYSILDVFERRAEARRGGPPPGRLQRLLEKLDAGTKPE